MIASSSTDCFNLTAPTGVEDEQTESILEMAKKTYHERKSSQGGAEQGAQHN